MTIAILIPTRGRPVLAEQAVAKLLDKSASDYTSIAVGMDDDEQGWDGLVDCRLKLSREPREDTLGAKYNRCAACAPDADIYMLWADDMVVTTPGFDKLIEDTAAQFTDGIGMVFFGKIPGVMQPGIAVTRRMVELMGELCEVEHPYWWQDTRLIEIGRMCGRIIEIPDVQVECLTQLKGNSRGVREISFWGQYFEAMRPERIAIAERVIDACNDQPFRKYQLRQMLPAWERIFREANSKCCDPIQANELEKHYGFDANPDERYLRVKSRAEAKLAAAQRKVA